MSFYLRSQEERHILIDGWLQTIEPRHEIDISRKAMY